MALSSNNPQMRDLNELRDHLKWIDDERRKSGRQMAELEQRLAQQGRELSERNQKIEELELKIANFSQKVDNLLGKTDPSGETEQRLQDLEMHVSNMNTQLNLIASPPDEQRRRQEEQAYLQEEIGRAISATHERVETSQSILEGQLRSEIAALQNSGDHQVLVSQLDQQADELNALKDAFAEFSARLRETTVSITADSQSHADSIAGTVQSQLDTLRAENKSTIEALTANLEAKLSQMPDRSADLSGELTQLQLTWEERLNQVEQTVGKLDPIREITPLLERIEQELELRKVEELRLSTLINEHEDRIATLTVSHDKPTGPDTARLDMLTDSKAELDEARAGSMAIDDRVEPGIVREDPHLSSLAERIAALGDSVMKAEAGLQAVSNDHGELREMIVNSTDELQRNQNEFAHQLEGWQAQMDENKDTIERFSQQWITLSNQYKEARMAVQNFAHWQKQVEQQKRDASEVIRLESNQMQERWDSFILEIQEKLKNFEIDLSQKWQAFESENEQRLSEIRRSEVQWRKEITAVDELIQQLQQDNRNLIWRVQTAQADAIKKWPRLLMEEVEKAVEINPNRRLATTNPLPSTGMSVVDAIEQGLITIDYNDDLEVDP